MTHWHWQNLNERKDGSHGSGFVNGRAWLYLGADCASQFGVEWHWSRRPQSFGVRVTREGPGGERDLSGAVHLGWFSFYAHASRVLPRRWLADRDKEYGLTYDAEGDLLSWRWAADPWSWSRSTPKWQYASCFVKDALFGRAKYREGEPETHRIVVEMPEGRYTGTCVLRADSWKRPLWPRRVVRRAHIDMDEGQQIPFPGKGENSWDCGDDATYGMTCPAESVEQAAATLRASVMRSRERYGGRDWTPARIPPTPSEGR